VPPLATALVHRGGDGAHFVVERAPLLEAREFRHVSLVPAGSKLSLSSSARSWRFLRSDDLGMGMLLEEPENRCYSYRTTKSNNRPCISRHASPDCLIADAVGMTSITFAPPPAVPEEPRNAAGTVSPARSKSHRGRSIWNAKVPKSTRGGARHSAGPARRPRRSVATAHASSAVFVTGPAVTILSLGTPIALAYLARSSPSCAASGYQGNQPTAETSREAFPALSSSIPPN